MKRRIMLLLCAACWLASWGMNYRFRHITSSDGLPHQQVEALAQDAKGNIWIGTRNGLARYDGYDIRSYFHDDSDSTSLNHNFVSHIFVDSSNRIWICTQGGLCRYRPATDDFKWYDELPGIISSVVETSRGRILCGGSGLWRYDDDADAFETIPVSVDGFISSLAIDKADNLYIATNQAIISMDAYLTKTTPLNAALHIDFLTGTDDILPMCVDSQQRLWLGRNGQGAMCVDKNGTIKVYEPADISNGIVRVITEDAQRRMWLGTEKGVTIVNPDGTIEMLRYRFQDPYQLGDNAIYAIISDQAGNIWIGSYFGGVDILLSTNKQFQWLEPGYQPGQLRGKVPRMMVETEPGLFWIATEDGGLNIYNRKTGQAAPAEQLPQVGTNVHSLYYDRQSREMWIGTFRNGLFRYRLDTKAYTHYQFSHGLKSNSVFSIVRQRNGRLWAATTQGLYYYDAAADQFRTLGDNILDRQFVYTLFVDDADTLWAGMNRNGLYRITPPDNNISYWQASPDALSDNYVTSLYQQPGSDTLWIGTNNNGLQYLDKKTGRFGDVGGDILLPHITVCSIIADSHGHLWVSTSQGLYCYTPATETLLRYTTESGLPTNQFNFSSAIQAGDSLMVFGTVNGLVTFNPTALADKTGPFEVHLKRLTVNNQVMTAATDNSPLTDELDETRTITLTYDQARSFSIDYGVIMPGSTNSIEYQVRLEGIDKTWRDVGGERKFSGYNLPAGTYHLHIRANNSNGGWDECPVKTLRITVRPPFYRSTWAYLFYLLLASLLAYVAYRFFMVRERERNAVREATMERDKIEAIDRAKFDFFTTVSHELKTPLSLIVAPLRSISRQQLDKGSSQHLDMAIKNTRKMESLINELITFNKVETDSFPFYVQKGNPLSFIEAMLGSFRESAAERGLSLLSEFEDNGEEVWFSPSYVERIVSNLLSNAMKFTPEGGRVTVKGRIADEPTELVITVQDTGIGIAKEEQSRIFDHFYQTKRGYNVNSSGWGIGLSLVKRLAEIHHGHVAVESEPGHGATFTVWLNVSDDAFQPGSYLNEDKTIIPLSEYKFTPSMSDTVTTYDADEVEYSEAQATLLIVDDNKDLLDFLANYFSAKYHVITATNGEEALSLAHSEQVQMVVSDVMMPGIDGVELCRRLKTDVQTSHLPVILLTAKTDQEDVAAGYKSGAEAYVSKPFDPQILEMQINNILQLQKTQQREIVATAEADISATSLSELDKQFIQKINELVEQNIANSDFNIADITAQMAISRSLLHTKMKNLTGMSMGDYIRHKRLDKACQLLQQGFNVSETAYRTGFSDPNYFSKAFKKQMGVNPTEYASDKPSAPKP